jgi:NADH-quinone oxidoreductase subunit L
MGGLRRKIPLTFAVFVIGYLALSAIPPFDGFWSKDAILAAAYHKSIALWVVGVITAFLTAYYMSRLMRLTFSGEARWSSAAAAHGAAGDTGHGGHGYGGPIEPHEPPRTMMVPLLLLAVASVVGFFLDAPFGDLDFLDKWLAPVFPTTIAASYHVATGTKWIIGLAATAAAVLGLITGLGVWAKAVDRPRFEPAVIRRGWYIDEAVSATVSGPLTGLANAFSFVIDAKWVDGLVNGLATGIAATGRQLRRAQTGYLRNYALGIGVGAAALLFYVSLRAGS